MNKEETLELYLKGSEAWNAWAKHMAEQHTGVVATGEWINTNGKKCYTTKGWRHAATVDFSEQHFENEMNFSNFVFPGDVHFREVVFANTNFNGARFIGDVRFAQTKFLNGTDFSEAVFRGKAIFQDIDFASAFFEGTIFAKEASFSKVSFLVAAFNNSQFRGNADFRHSKFTTLASFADTTFRKEARFIGATFDREVLFWRTLFGQRASFNGTTFNGCVEFHTATFEGDAIFGEALFKQTANFGGLTFARNAEFNNVVFNDNAEFAGARFDGNAGFNKASFKSYAHFNGARFAGSADFTQAVFEFASFQDVYFEADSFFIAMRGQSFFSLTNARFLFLPNFEQAHFVEAPQLDNLNIQLTSSNPKSLWKFQSPSAKPNMVARWRALKRLAIQGHDYERELNFLAEEVKALRGGQDWPLPNPLSFRKGDPICWPGGGRYWFGFFYQWLSDFGRSTLRPFLCWLIVTGLSALFYFNYSPPQNLDSRSHTTVGIVAPICDPAMDALYLSIHNGLVVSGLGRGEKLAQSYICLYGNSGKNQLIPIMPNTVVLVGIGQTILSAVLIFLFLLALRNYFRIK
jgi:uncharacterized protein YjbI with pentapeptide repeats